MPNDAEASLGREGVGYHAVLSVFAMNICFRFPSGRIESLWQAHKKKPMLPKLENCLVEF